MSSTTILGLSGNVTSPSRTATLVRATVDSLVARTGARGDIIEIATVAPLLLSALTRATISAEGEAILRQIETADVLVVGSPVYRASYTGALKHVFDLVGFDALAGKPVILAATGGSPLHGLVPDHQLRPLLAFFRAQPADHALCRRERLHRLPPDERRHRGADRAGERGGGKLRFRRPARAGPSPGRSGLILRTSGRLR